MKSAHARSCIALAMMLSFAACSSELKDVPATTQVTLRLSSDASLRDRIDKVRLSLWVLQPRSGPRAGEFQSIQDQWRAGSSIEVAVGAQDWPLDVPVLPKGSAEAESNFEVIIEAYSKGVSVLRTRVVSYFVANTLAVVPATLATCPTVDLTCSGTDCHGAECKTCNVSGVCAPAGLSPRTIIIDIPVADSGSPTKPANGGSDAASASDTNQPDGAAPATNDVRDSGVPSVAPTPDAAVAPVVDSGSAQPDAGAPDAGATKTCPAQNSCNALLYPCVPTSAGYTCQGQLADWPMPDGVTGAKVAPSFTSTGETAIDNVTKLEWQLGLPNTYPGCTSRKQLANGVQGPYAEWCTREEGIKYCAELVRGKHDDWRLPSMIELTSLFDMRDPPASANAVDLNFFGDSSSQQFISRSTGAGAPSKTWMVSYEYREIIVFNNQSGRVRCVRGGAEPSFATPADRYLVGADTVTDRATTLVWQRGFSPAPIEEGGAEAYCAALGVGFRVPTSNELMTLVDTTRPPPAIDTTAFPNTPSAAFALPATLVRESSVSFETGMLQLSSSAPSYVRCVRNQ